MIDGDQGKSGASSENRSGFRDLMARIAAGEVGLVLSLRGLAAGPQQRRLPPVAARGRHHRHPDTR